MPFHLCPFPVFRLVPSFRSDAPKGIYTYLAMKPCLILPFQDSMVDSLLQFAVTYKDRVRMDLIKPAVDWRAKTEQAAAASK